MHGESKSGYPPAHRWFIQYRVVFPCQSRMCVFEIRGRICARVMNEINVEMPLKMVLSARRAGSAFVQTVELVMARNSTDQKGFHDVLIQGMFVSRFHDMFPDTVCLCTSPDLKGVQGMFHDMFTVC